MTAPGQVPPPVGPGGTKPTKALVAGAAAVADGLSVLTTATFLHGDALLAVLALIAFLHSLGATYGVWRVTNAAKD